MSLKSYKPISPHIPRGNSNSLFNLANRPSLNLFFGNMPLTARLSTSPPPHFSINLSRLMLFKLPGLVVWV